MAFAHEIHHITPHHNKTRIERKTAREQENERCNDKVTTTQFIYDETQMDEAYAFEMRKPTFKWFYLPIASLIEYRFDNLRTIFSFDCSTDGQSNFMFPLCIERQNFSNVRTNEHTWWQQIESNIHDSLTNYKTHKKGWHQIKLACCKQSVILSLSISFILF